MQIKQWGSKALQDNSPNSANNDDALAEAIHEGVEGIIEAYAYEIEAGVVLSRDDWLTLEDEASNISREREKAGKTPVSPYFLQNCWSEAQQRVWFRRAALFIEMLRAEELHERAIEADLPEGVVDLRHLQRKMNEKLAG